MTRARALALAGLLCACAASPALAALPTIESVQDAYDAARVDNADRHVYDLVIRHAKCDAIKAGGYACQIDFVRRDEPEKRLFFDVVTIDERQGRWTLLSGLCVKTPR